MSTKTTLKRIALVAVSALSISVFSAVAPASAVSAGKLGSVTTQPTAPTQDAYIDATSNLTCTKSLEADSTGATTCTGSVDGEVHLWYTPAAADSATVITAKVSGMKILGAGNSTVGSSGVDLEYVNSTDFTDGVFYTPGTGTPGELLLVLTASAAGSGTVTISKINSTTGARTTLTSGSITWQTSGLTASTGTSTAFFTTSFSAYPTVALASTTSLNSSMATTVQAAAVLVSVKEANGNPLYGQSITAEVSGPGLIGGAVYTGTAATDLTTAATGRSVTLTGTAMASEYRSVFTVWGDGTSGTSTITIKRGTTVLKTQTVTFYGALAKLEATAIYGSILRNPTSATADVVEVYATDANGIPTEGRTIVQSAASVAADNGGAVTGWSCSEYDAVVYPGYYYCVPSGWGTSAGAAVYGKVNVAFSNSVVAAAVLATSNSVSFDVVRSTITTTTISLDKTSYAPGEKATLTITALDADGKGIAEDGTWTSIFETWSNYATSTGLPTGLSAPVAGSQSYTVYAPTTSGEWTITLRTPATGATGSTSYALAGRGKTLTATATVTATATDKAAEAASDAAAEAIDAANAATDAANLAAEAADAATVAAEEARDAADAATAAVEELATQVATLMAALKAQITTLANTVAKIAKKVKA
jgi:hypothetical protein